MGTPDPIANQGKILKSHGIKRVNIGSQWSVSRENVRKGLIIRVMNYP